MGITLSSENVTAQLSTARAAPLSNNGCWGSGTRAAEVVAFPLPARALSPFLEPSSLAGPEVSADILLYTDQQLASLKLVRNWKQYKYPLPGDG